MRRLLVVLTVLAGLAVVSSLVVPNLLQARKAFSGVGP